MRRTAAFLLFWIIFVSILFVMFGAFYWYWELRRIPVTVTVLNETLHDPREAIELHFSEKVLPFSFNNKIAMAPAHPVRSEWSDDFQTLFLVPEENWPLETVYQVQVEPGRTQWYGHTNEATLSVHSPDYPTVIETSPKIEEENVVLDIEDPLKVIFDRSVRDFYVDFRLDPPVPMVYQNNADKTAFDILPSEALKTGTQYTLSMYAKWRGAPDADYHLLHDIQFTTPQPTRSPAPPNLAARTEAAKRTTQAKIVAGKYIDINLETQVMTLFENGQALDSYIVSSGRRGLDTPKGQFSIHNKADRPWSKQYGLYMPYWQAITPDGKYGIHELPEWPGGYKEGANHLGTPVSHGCVRLGIGAAARVYAWTDIGTPIVIY